MTNYVCARHGDIGRDVLDTERMFDALTPEGNHILSQAAYPKQTHICARCLKALIDDQFAPLREKQK